MIFWQCISGDLNTEASGDIGAFLRNTEEEGELGEKGGVSVE